MSETKLTKAQLRVAVAKDVLESLKLLRVRNGTYLYKCTETLLEFSEKGVDSKKDAQALKSNCNVCALGALFLSTVTLDNKFDFSKAEVWQYDDLSEDSLRSRLEKVFSPKQLGMIEAAFEQAGEFCADSDIGDVCETFGRRFENSEKRLEAILNNIIENDGTFNP